MNRDIIRISNPHEFAEIEQTARQVFDFEKIIPNQVFKPIFKKFHFTEFHLAMYSEFWNTLQQLALSSNDQTVIMAVLDPSPSNFFYSKFGHYNWFKIPTLSSPDDYQDVIDLESERNPAESLLDNSETIIWFSPSLKWGVWGERGAEVCILSMEDPSLLQERGDLLQTWLTAEEALTDLFPLTFWNHGVPSEFSKALKDNYSNNA